MGDFATAVTFVLTNEGGFNDDPAHDSGGATNFGISLRFLREIHPERLRKYGIFASHETLGVEHIKELTVDQARLIYKGEFWELAPFDHIDSNRIASYVFDSCVLHGMCQGIKILQRATWPMTAHKVLDDGTLGNATLTTVNLLMAAFMEVTLQAERAGYCRLLAEIRPKDRENLNGWLKRCYTF